MIKNEVSANEVYNMDEMGINFEFITSKIVAPIGEKNVHYKTGGKEKLRTTVIFLVKYGMQPGDRLPKPFIIFKGSPKGPLSR